MSKNFFDVAHAHSKASNKNSAMAVSGGLSYSPSDDGYDDFDVPPPYWLLRELPMFFGKNTGSIKTVSALYGRRSFRLTVLGLSKVQRDSNRTRYVCKCSCGMYCLRQMRSIKNNPYSSCGICKKNHQRVLNEHYAKTGTYLPDAQVWQRMGGA